jgi:MFS transporter, DHA1 family, solute carrier family 18 (vesicular amine transporter), member 1/2
MDLVMSAINRLRVRSVPRQWLVYALFFVSGVAQAAIVPLLPRLSSQFALSATETALLLALPGLATLAVSVPAGLAADRFGARRVTLMAGVLLCLASLAQATPSLAVLLAGRVLFGIGFGVVWTTGMAWLSDMDTGNGRSMGPAVTCSSVGIMAGPAVGGMLAELAGVSVAFMAVAGIAAAVVVPLAFVPDGQRRPAEGDPAPAARSGSATAGVLGTLALLRRPGIGAATGALVVSGAVSGVSQLLISTGLHRAGVSTGRIGLAFSAAAVCYIIVSTGVVRLGTRVHTLRFNAAATTLLAVALLPAASGVGAVALIAALLLSAGPRAAVSTIAYSLASTAEDSGAAGETSGAAAGRDGVVFGLLNGAWAASMVLMPLLAGAMEQQDGTRAGFLAVILPSCLIAVLLLARSGPAGARLRQRVRGLVSAG